MAILYRDRTKSITEKVVDDILCSKCGNSLKIVISGIDSGYNGLIVDQKWFYGSKKDGERHTFQLCEDCYDDIVESNIIDVEKMEYIYNENFGVS
jgi:hypothetical protein